MPYKKRYKKYRKKRSNFHHKRRTVSQVRAPISDSQVIKMRYCETIEIHPAVDGIIGTHVFSANNAFDPNVTGTGHQPMGFDQWSVFYDHITVIGSKIRATYIPGSSPFIALIHTADNATLSTVPNTVLERTGTQWKWLGNAGAGGNTGNTLKKFFSTKKFFNVTDVKDNAMLKGSFTTSPAEQAYYHVSLFQPNAGALGDVAVTIEIEYICQLSERKDLVSS